MNNSDLLDEFCDNLWLEDGLSRNTLDSYRLDLTKFAAWLEQQRGLPILQTTHGDIQGYLAHLFVVQKAKPSSTGRNISSLKRLFRYLLRQSKIATDPTLQIDTPKLPCNLPKSLTEQDVEQLLNAPDTQTPLGLRDRHHEMIQHAHIYQPEGVVMHENSGGAVRQRAFDHRAFAGYAGVQEDRQKFGIG